MLRGTYHRRGEIEDAKEGREIGFPKLQFELFFGEHATAKDAEAFLVLAKDADIIGFEASGMEPRIKTLVQKLSDGGATIPRILPEGSSVFGEAILRGLQGIRKPIIFADIKPGLEDSLYNTFIDYVEKQELKAVLDFRYGDFTRAMRRIKLLKLFIEKPNAYREKIIAARLTGEAQKIIKKTKSLRAKDLVRIFFFLGGAHLPILSERSLPKGTHLHIAEPRTKHTFEQVYHLLRRKKQVPDVLYARMIVEDVLNEFLQQKYVTAKLTHAERMNHAPTILDVAHLIAQQMKEQEMRFLSEELGKIEKDHASSVTQSDAFFLPEQMDSIEQVATQKEMDLPDSLDDLAGFVSAHGPRWKIGDTTK